MVKRIIIGTLMMRMSLMGIVIDNILQISVADNTATVTQTTIATESTGETGLAT